MASNSDTVVIFDTPSKDGKIWSHHVLRILFSVHYKGIPYSIAGVEYPDIVSTFASTTLEPKNDTIEPYEIPVLKVQTSDGIPRYYMTTLEIIQALENIQPERPLLYTSSRSAEFRDRFGPAFTPIIQAIVGHVPNILSEPSAKAFTQKRKDRWRKSVEQWIAEHPPMQGLAKAEVRFKDLGEWLDLTPGPFVHGDQTSYSDFTIASILGFVKAVGFADMFQNLLNTHPAIRRLYDAVKLTQLGGPAQSLFETV